MRDDLGAGGGEVHAMAREVLQFWFAELSPDRHFEKSDALDATIAARFGGLLAHLRATAAMGWDRDADTMLAAIIVLDQFSRNINRGEATAFIADTLALSLTLRAIQQGCDAEMSEARRVFLYMPLMHAEDVELQRLSVEKFTALGIEENVKFAKAHQAVIERFGRFPSRNAAIGRPSTAAERDYLSQPGAGW